MSGYNEEEKGSLNEENGEQNLPLPALRAEKSDTRIVSYEVTSASSIKSVIKLMKMSAEYSNYETYERTSWPTSRR